MGKNEGFWQFHLNKPLVDEGFQTMKKRGKNIKQGSLTMYISLEGWWLKHQQLLFHETYRLGDPNHAQPIIRGVWGNWYQVINHTYSNSCWWNSRWNSNVSWLNQSSNMIHFDIPCFLDFSVNILPMDFLVNTPYVSTKMPKTITFVDEMWMKSPILKVWNTMKYHEMPPKLPTPQAPKLGTARCLRSSLCPQGSISASGGAWRFSWLQTAASSALASSVPKTCGVSRGALGSHGILKGKSWKNHGKTWENHGFVCDISGFPAFVSIQFEENMWNQGTWGFHKL